MSTLLNNRSYGFFLGHGRYNAYINSQKLFDVSNTAYERSHISDLIWDQNTSSYKTPITIKINPTPSDATVVLTADGYTQVGNSITVGSGTTITYTVSKSGYSTVTDTITSNINQTIPIRLYISQVTLTINTNPEDSIVKFIVDNYSDQTKKYITLPVGTIVDYEVFRDGLNTVRGHEILTNNISRSVILTYSIILHCDGIEWDEYIDTSDLEGITYKWRYPKVNVYVNNILMLNGVKPNNTFGLRNVLPGNSYIINQTYTFVDYEDGGTIKTETHNFSFGNLPANGLLLDLDITTDYENGSAMSSQYVNQASYDVYITT